MCSAVVSGLTWWSLHTNVSHRLLPRNFRHWVKFMPSYQMWKHANCTTKLVRRVCALKCDLHSMRGVSHSLLSHYLRTCHHNVMCSIGLVVGFPLLHITLRTINNMLYAIRCPILIPCSLIAIMSQRFYMQPPPCISACFLRRILIRRLLWSCLVLSIWKQ